MTFIEQTIGQVLDQRAKTTPDKDALIVDGGVYTWKDVEAITNYIAKDMKDNPGKWTYLKMLNSNNKKNWKQPLVNILFASGLFKRPPIDYYVLADFIIFLSFNWDVSLVRLLKSLKQKGISIENYFDYERKVSFYLATLLHDINEPQIIRGNSLEKNVRDYDENDKLLETSDVISADFTFSGGSVDFHVC